MHLHRFIKKPGSTPTSPTSLMTFQTFTWSNDSWAKSGIWCFHVACMQGHCSFLFQHKRKGKIVSSCGWLGTRTPQCNFLFIWKEKHNSLTFLFPSTLTRNNAWIQTGWCCDFRRRQQYHPWIQTVPSSERRSTIHSPFSFLPPSPTTMHRSKRDGVVTSVVDNSTTPGSKRCFSWRFVLVGLCLSWYAFRCHS